MSVNRGFALYTECEPVPDEDGTVEADRGDHRIVPIPSDVHDIYTKADPLGQPRQYAV